MRPGADTAFMRPIRPTRYHVCPTCHAKHLDPIPTPEPESSLPTFIAGLGFGALGIGLIWLALGFVWVW